MAFMPFTKEDQPTMAKFNEKFLEAILEGKTQALDAGVKIATGSYVGTGIYTETDYTELHIGFNPKFLFIAPATGSVYYSNTSSTIFHNRFLWTDGVTQSTMYNYNGATILYCSVENGVFKFKQYASNATTNTRIQGINTSGIEYRWVAIG